MGEPQAQGAEQRAPRPLAGMDDYGRPPSELNRAVDVLEAKVRRDIRSPLQVGFPPFTTYFLSGNGVLYRRCRGPMAGRVYAFRPPEPPHKYDRAFHRPVTRRCLACEYWVLHEQSGEVPEDGYCSRFPQLERTAWHRWCGEFKSILSPWDRLRAWWQATRRKNRRARKHIKAHSEAHHHDSEARYWGQEG